MIIVDKALARLEAEGRPIRVAVIGAGFQGAAVVRQIVKSTPGMRVVGVANRRGEAAVRAYADVGVEASRVEGRPAIENVLASGGRSEERRVGNEWVRTCSSRWSPDT